MVRSTASMKKQKIKNPLHRRILRELIGDWKKYLVVSLFLILTIGFVSGMYVANESMMTAADQGITRYKLENGHFELKSKADTELLEAIAHGEKADIKAYYLNKAKTELDEKFENEFKPAFTKEFDSKFKKEFDALFEKQVRSKLSSQPPDESIVSAILPTVLQEATKNGQYQAAYDSAYKDAFQAAYDEAYHKAYDSAWSQFTDEADKKFADPEEKARYLEQTKPAFTENFKNEFTPAFTKEFDSKFKKEFDASFEKQIKNTLSSQPLDKNTISAILPMVLKQAKKSGEYQNAYNSAYQKAFQSAYNEAYGKAYKEAWGEIVSEVDKKYADAEEKYELNNPDFHPVPVTVYENFYRNEDEDNNNDGTADGTVRVYAKTEDINLACLLDGRFPETKNEIAIDRMHADNVGIKVGDTITIGEKEWNVVGLIAYVNYSTLHEKSSDFMFDALKFNVAMVTENGFAQLEKPIHYAYAWQYAHAPMDEKKEKKMSDDFMKALLTQAVANENELEDYLPAYANQAIHFATDDMGSDEAMGGVLLDILIVIIAFIFAVTISNTIAKESKTIGTLRASGYTRMELLRHYLAMPVIVTLFAAAAGNLLGYTVFKNIIVSMYYNSYSLPAYETVWNPTAFFKTTIIPLLLMFIVNLVVIWRKMRHTPLAFLRQDLKKNKRKKAIRLPNWKFFSRFRIRIIFQNIPNYLILFFGIFFVCVMLSMAIGLPNTLDYYKDNAKDMMFANYQYVLTSFEDEDAKAITTETENAEIFGMKSLQKKSDAIDEEVSVYGIADGSNYVKIDGLDALTENEVYISNSFADKYNIFVGDTVTLQEKYENKQYSFKVAGFYGKSLNISVFMPIEQFRTTFDLKEGEFTGYLSDTQITDISEDNIAAVITEGDITKMCDQLDHSMGSYMQYFQVLCILLSAVLIYLLTKIIIEKNENAISMVKILGYENGEIAKLYLLSTSIILVIADAISVFLGSFIMDAAWKTIMFRYSGWYTFTMNPLGYAKMFLFVLIGYLIVLGFDFRRIKKIPLDKVLKNAD